MCVRFVMVIVPKHCRQAKVKYHDNQIYIHLYGVHVCIHIYIIIESNSAKW